MSSERLKLSTKTMTYVSAIAQPGLNTRRHCIFALIVLLSLLALPVKSIAQSNTEFANCQEVTDPDAQMQMDLCKAHAGCRIVLSVQKACTKVRGLLDGLRDSVSQRVGALFGAQREVLDDDVWNAVQTPVTRRIDELPASRETSAALREQFRQPVSSRPQEVRSPDGRMFVYSGAIRDGQPDGRGVRYTTDGTIIRGNWQAGQLNGDAEQVGPGATGEMFRRTGRFEGGQFRAGTLSTTAGISSGRFQDNRLVEGTRTRQDGVREEGRFEGFYLVEGSRYSADGNLLERGRFREGRLAQGERYAGGQVVERVSTQSDAMRLAEAQQQAGIESARQERERAAAAEAAFRSQLERGNAGQLLALADELQEKGQNDAAREALRALVRRFPNSPLTAQAVKQLSQQPATERTNVSANIASAGRTPVSAPTSETQLRSCLPSRDEWRRHLLQACANHPSPGIRDTCRQNPDALVPKTEETWSRLERQSLESLNLSDLAAYSRNLSAGDPMIKSVACAQQLRGGTAAALPSSSERFVSARYSQFGQPNGNVCAGEPLSNPRYEAALARLPSSSPSLLIRGALVGIDMQIDALRNCSPTPVLARQIRELENQRAAALQTCRQIVSQDICLQSPF